jgi:hypothetical protein
MSIHRPAGSRDTLTGGVAALAAAATALLLAQSALAVESEWVSIAKTERTEVFANPASLGTSPAGWVIVRTKQNFVDAQPSAKKNKPFLSARNEYRADCAQRRLAYSQMEAFAQLDLQGDSVQKTKIGEKNLKWMDAPSDTVFGEILDYACKGAPAGA